MKKTKTEKGITLIALIITIVVLLILAVVTIGTIRNSKIIEHTETAKDIYKEEQIKEEVELFNAEYLLTTKRNMQDLTKNKMIDICKKTGVKAEQLAIHYDLCNANTNKENGNKEKIEEFVLYRLDKTTAEEQAILEQNEVLPLRGDVDMDGYLTENDANLLYDYDSYVIDDDEFENVDFQIGVMGDITGDDWGSNGDANFIIRIVIGLQRYGGGYIQEYLD